MLPVIKAANVVNDHGPTGLPYKVIKQFLIGWKQYYRTEYLRVFSIGHKLNGKKWFVVECENVIMISSKEK